MPVKKSIGIVGEHLHIFRRHIERIPLHVAGGIGRGIAAVPVGILPSLKSRRNGIHGCRIQQFLLIHIHIEAFVQIPFHRVQVEIHRVVPEHGFLFHHLILEDNRQLTLSHAVIFVQIRKLLAVGILVQNLPPKTHDADDCDQHQRHDYRYNLLFHLPLTFLQMWMHSLPVHSNMMRPQTASSNIITHLWNQVIIKINIVRYKRFAVYSFSLYSHAETPPPSAREAIPFSADGGVPIMCLSAGAFCPAPCPRPVTYLLRPFTSASLCQSAPAR